MLPLPSSLSALLYALSSSQLAFRHATEYAKPYSPRLLSYAKFKFQTGDLAAARTIIIDVSGIRFITSFGVRQWLRAM